ncbi:DoxX family protein [Aestuariivirga sp.]|uniref:DoxX family protein n=1 Tax=Aestuariivirga sp. TaxID=2650926 RepID=UPI003BA953C2
MARLIDATSGLFERIPYAVIGLLGRLSLAWLFWSDGRARMDGSWNVLQPRYETMAMFRGGYDIRYVPYEFAAIAVQVAELALPVLLALGIASRFAALGLLVLVIVFEIFVHPGPYAIHGVWAALLLVIIKFGPGSLSLDEVLGRR